MPLVSPLMPVPLSVPAVIGRICFTGMGGDVGGFVSRVALK